MPNSRADLRDAITESGGIAAATDLAERWGISVQRVRSLARMPTFPQPIGLVGKARTRVYLVAECDAFRLRMKVPTRGE